MTLLGFIPGFTNLAQAWVTKSYDTKLRMYTARVGGDVEMAKQLLQAEVQNNATKVGWIQAISASPVLAFVVVGFAFPFIFYLNKVVVWDICLGLGTTPELKYELLSNWGTAILSGIFITSGAAGTAAAIFIRK